MKKLLLIISIFFTACGHTQPSAWEDFGATSTVVITKRPYSELNSSQKVAKAQELLEQRRRLEPTQASTSPTWTNKPPEPKKTNVEIWAEKILNHKPSSVTSGVVVKKTTPQFANKRTRELDKTADKYVPNLIKPIFRNVVRHKTKYLLNYSCSAVHEQTYTLAQAKYVVIWINTRYKNKVDYRGVVRSFQSSQYYGKWSRYVIIWRKR